jgi:hypothetical protein
MSFIHAICTCLILAGFQGKAQSTWQLNKEKRGIKVFTKDSDSSSFKSIRVEGVFDGTWSKLAAILMDINGQVRWVYRTEKSYVVKKISPTEVVYYTETTLPWPLSNRETIVRLKLTYDSVQKTGRVISRHEPNAIPIKKGLVRVSYYKAIWHVRQLEANKIAISYFLEVDPGGTLPPAVANMFVSTGPYETFSRLAAILKE